MSKEFKEDQSVEKPFTIRGHHLEQFVYLLGMHNLDPKKFGKNLAEGTKNREEGYMEYPNYKTDIIGNTPEEMDLYIQRNIELAERFLNLPDDYPVKIIFGKPDEICKTCIIGNHCKIVSNNYDWHAAHTLMPIGKIKTVGSLKSEIISYFKIRTPKRA